MKNFWQTLPRPVFALAPMADVSDPAFRRIIAKYSKSADVGRPQIVPFVMWTEFVSADGLALAPEEGRQKLLKDLEYSEAERPIVAQFFTGKPENMEKAAELAHELGFDGVDINMGCPDRSIEKQGAGAAHMKDPARAQDVIYAALQGAQGLPVSVKTRLGYNKDELDTWLPKLLETKLSAITIHARTRKEMSKVPARWERIRDAVRIRDTFVKGDPLHKTLILGNGDVKDMQDARHKVVESGADGAMLGRAIFGAPWLFAEKIPSIQEKLNVMVEHTKLFEELLPHKSFAIMKKHYKAYVKDFPGAHELRAQLMEAENADTVKKTVEAFCYTNVQL